MKPFPATRADLSRALRALMTWAPLLTLALATQLNAAPDASQAGCAIGDCVNGTGTYLYPSGDEYAGGFVNGLREGAGSYRYANGDRLDVTFRRGQPAGSGTYRFQDGRLFHGEFTGRAGNLSGKGILVGPKQSLFCTLDQRTLRCENKAETTKRSHLLVLYANETCRIHRNGQVLPGGPGIPLFAGDRIQSDAETVELQGRGGIAIRLRPYSELEIPPETSSQGGALHLRKGGVAVDYQGDPTKIPFRIVTDDASFDVEGTTFTVEIDEARGTAKVRVFEGTVSLSPTLPALTKLKLEKNVPNAPGASGEISAGALSDSELQRVAEAIESQTTRVQANQEGQLSDETRTRAQRLNTAIETTVEGRTVEGREKDPSTTGETAARPDDATAGPSLTEATEQLQASPTAKPEKFEATAQESAELKLLITIDESTFESAMRNADPANPVKQDSVEAAYEKKLDTQATALEKELAADDTIRSQADLIKRYKFLEVVTFTDGNQKAGSIAAQAGNILILHAPDGVFRMNRDDVKQVDFYDVIQE